MQTGSDKDNKLNYIATSHLSRIEKTTGSIFKKVVGTTKIKSWFHSHPSNTPRPSGLKNREADISTAATIEKIAGYKIDTKIYLPGLFIYIDYDKNSTKQDFKGYRRH